MNEANSISRTPLRIKINTLPDSHFGQWFTHDFILECRFKPAINDTQIMAEISPLFQIKNKENLELYRFQTETIFSFSGLHSKAFINGVMHQIMNVAIDEFNSALQQTKSLLAVKKTFVKLTKAEIENYVEEAYKIDYTQTYGIVPYWKNLPSKTEKENDEIISSLPLIPNSKKFENNVTEEQILLLKGYNSESFNEEEKTKIKTIIQFYKDCFRLLKQIDLRILNDSQFEKLKLYLNKVFSINPIINNDVSIDNLFRVTTIWNEALENGKVRDTKYLTYPPLKVNKCKGVFNRANSPDRTLFYAATSDNVAIRESHPDIKKRIIVANWQNSTNFIFNTFPLCMTGGIKNDYADKNNYAFEKIKEAVDPLVAKWMECFLEFYSSEFIKDTEPINPKRYDYLFSAFFADYILQPFPPNSGLKDFDCIVYPSVAWNHIPDNFAILPHVIDTNFKIIDLKEFEIMNTWYDKKIDINQYPAELKFIRQSKSIINNKIIWNDD